MNKKEVSTVISIFVSLEVFTFCLSVTGIFYYPFWHIYINSVLFSPVFSCVRKSLMLSVCLSIMVRGPDMEILFPQPTGSWTQSWRFTKSNRKKQIFTQQQVAKCTIMLSTRKTEHHVNEEQRKQKSSFNVFLNCQPSPKFWLCLRWTLCSFTHNVPTFFTLLDGLLGVSRWQLTVGFFSDTMTAVDQSEHLLVTYMYGFEEPTLVNMVHSIKSSGFFY